VLVVDDHPVTRQGIVDMLEEAPDIETVATADNGRVAVEKARELRPDVILMDSRMPEMDGTQATRRIKSEFPEMHVLGLSISESPHVVQDMLNAGADEFLGKESPIEVITSAIRACMEGQKGDERPTE
jgi:DNA-binding NarL/FixJ family response regulator